MKSYFIVLLAVALLFASTAQIPFDFVVGNTVYSAGTYTIGPATQSSSAPLLDGGEQWWYYCLTHHIHC